MKKFLLLFGIFIFSACGNSDFLKNDLSLSTISGDYDFSVEIADTEDKQEKGLMFRENLSENAGMLFVFPDAAFVSMWMKNTLIPLDVVFFDEEKHVNAFLKNLPPCKLEECEKYLSAQPALYMLELNAGTIDKINLNLGDSFSLKP